MLNIWRITIGFLLIAGSLIFRPVCAQYKLNGVSQPVGGSAAQGHSSASLMTSANSGWVELTDRRTDRSKTYLDSAGMFHLAETAGFFHFRNESGDWEDLQRQLAPWSENPGWTGLERTELPVRIDRNQGVARMTLKKTGEAIVFGERTLMEWADVDLNIIGQIMPEQPRGVADVQGNTVEFSEYYPGVDREHHADYWQLQTNYVLNERPVFPTGASKLMFTDEFILPSNWSVKTLEGEMTEAGWQGTLGISDEYGTEVGQISAPVFYDAVAGQPNPATERHAIIGTFRLEQVANGMKISVVVPVNWLNSPELVYPVTIDPTITNTYAAVQGVQDWMTQFSGNCQASMTLTLPPGPNFTVTNTSIQYSILSQGTIATLGWTTYYAAGFEQRSRVGIGANWTPTQFGFGDSMSPQTVPYNIPASTIANGCYTGGTPLVFNWQAYNIYFPDFGGSAATSVVGCVTNYHRLLANTWVVTVTYTDTQVTVTPSPMSQVLCSGQNAGISLSSNPPGANFSWTVVQTGVAGAVNGSGTSIQHQLVTTASATGTAVYTITPSLNGCPGNPQNVTVTVHPQYTNLSESAQICQGETYAFGGTDYAANGQYSHTFQTTNGCDSTVVLNLTVVDVLNATVDQTICQGESYNFNGNAYSSAGTYEASLVSSGGCDSIVTLNLSVNPVFNTSFSASVCEGSAYTYQGVNYSTTGLYPVIFQSAGGCDSTVTLDLTVIPPYSETIDATICQGGSYSFEGSDYSAAGLYSVTYQDANGCDSIRTLNLSISAGFFTNVPVGICEGESYLFNGNTYSDEGSYVANLVAAGGCDSTVTLILTVHPLHSVNISGDICEGETYPFNGTLYSSSGSYTGNFVSQYGCDSIVTLSLTVYPVPEVEIGQEYDLCKGESLLLFNEGDGGSYLWSTGSTAQTITVTGSDTYWLQVAGPNACFGRDTAEVRFHPLPTAFLNTDFTICDGSSIIVDAGNEGSSYLWSTGETSQSVVLNQAGYYTVTITNEFGCARENFVNIGEFCESSLFIPNSFTPDNDGFNDSFRAYGDNVAEFEMAIYSRWGEEVFFTDKFDQPWDGSFRKGGYYLQDGFYNWLVRYKVYTDAFGKVSEWKKLTGHVLMLR